MTPCRLDSTGANTPVKGPFLTHEHQAAWAISLTSRRTSCTTFAVWMPKKMYRISVNFVLALMRFRPRTATLDEWRLYSSILAVLPVGAAGITCVSSDLLHVHTEELSVHLQAVRKPGSLVEGIEWQLLDEWESVNLDVVALRTKLYVLHFSEQREKRQKQPFGVYFAKTGCKIEAGFADVFRLKSWNLVFGQSDIWSDFTPVQVYKFCCQKRKWPESFSHGAAISFLPFKIKTKYN